MCPRGVRAFGDGFVALLLPIYLVERGFNALAIGAIVTGTLIGTSLTTLWVGWIATGIPDACFRCRLGPDGGDRGRRCGRYGVTP